MKAKTSSLLLILLVISASRSQQRIDYGNTPWGPIDVVWTHVSPEECKVVTRWQNSPFRVCPRVAGYQLLYSGDEASPQIVIVTPNRKRHVIHYWDLNAGNFISLAKGVTWKLVRSRTGKITPLALMLQANIKLDESTRFQNPYTIIAKLTPTEVCVVGRVPANSTSAADIAGVSTSARSKRCVGLEDVGEKDWGGVIFGMIKKGRYEEAKSALKELPSTGARISFYGNIARAQNQSGDRKAAGATALQGLQEVLNEKEETIYFNAYGQEVHQSTRASDLIGILETMAAVGLDEEVNNNLRFVSSSDLPQALLFIGKAQGSSRFAGDRGDREAAAATFKRAVQLELMRANTTQTDWNLVSIVDAQAEVGLINEARQTLLSIKDPSARKHAEHIIDRRIGTPD